jgi:predicted hydrocarbon binding protein
MRNCECCGATYSTGKDYGDYWTELSLADETKGLCEFCNKNNETWYIKDKECNNVWNHLERV